MTRSELRMAIAAACLGLGLVGLVSCWGAGDGFVAGIGNGGTRIYANPVLDEVVDALAADPELPTITDEMLLAGFDAIRRHAAEGDPQAVLILYQVAERQRVEAE
jgi:hypothetical protein